jgi:hypothetical protein
MEQQKQEKEKKKRKEKKKQKKKDKKKSKRNQEELLLPQRTGLEICHLKWPANVLTMMFSPPICATLLKNDLHSLKDVIKDIMTTSTSPPKRCTIGPLAQLNSIVSSWTTNGKATTAGSLLVFEDNVGEDGLSSQST